MNEQIITILQKIADEIADGPTYYDKYDIIDEIITPKIKKYSKRYDIINLSNEKEVNNIEEKRNYVVYTENLNMEEQEHIIKMTQEQANAINWFMSNFNIEGCVVLAENYNGEEI